MIKKRHVLHLAMGVVMTSLLGSCAADEIVGGAGSGNGVLSFGVEVNAGASEVKPMGGATRSAEKTDSSAVMSPDVEGFFPTSSVELSSIDGNAIYANCDERRGINMHNNVDYKATRGSIQTQDDFYESFALYGYVYDSGKTWANDGGSISVDTKISGIEMKKGTGDEYTANTNPKVYWPGGSKNATFFAVAPYNSTAAAVSAESGGPKITYTVPQTVSDQEDLLLAVAKNVKCDGKNAPSLTFNHALAAIKFVKGDLGGFTDITKVEIIGVNNQGKLSSFDTREWTVETTSTDSYSISSLSDVMFLMPQDFPDDAEIKVKFSDGSNLQEFTAKLKDETHTSWQAGHQYTYSLSVNEVTGSFIFEVISLTESVPVGGGEATFNVKSYFQYQNGSKTVPIPWSCSYTDDGEIKTINGDGSVDGENKSITIGVNTITHTQVLQNNPVKGSQAFPYDLSTNGGASSMNTANCYVVNSKGTYSIPLVYGCAIKNGIINSMAYGYDGNSYISETFKRHDDQIITDPYINNNGITVDGAELLWQEVPGLIKEVKVENEKIIFTIGDNIAQGNALIAAKYGSTIVWSWHIWVTDRDIYATVPIQTVAVAGTSQHTYDFMQVPLGWVDMAEGVSSRAYTVNLTQSQSNKPLMAKVIQAGLPTSTGTCPYYQWGRKDPFCPSDGTSNEDKPLYDISGSTVSMKKGDVSVVTGESIKNPNTFYYSSSTSEWNTETYYDYWNATNRNNTDMNDKEVVKTVYDPNPVGFKMPSPDAFTGFTEDGSNQNNTTENWNVESTTLKNGYKFYTNGWKEEPTDFWCANGCRAYDSGSLSRVGYSGLYWSAGPYSITGGRDLSFKSDGVRPQYGNYRAFGFTVRPVSE